MPPKRNPLTDPLPQEHVNYRGMRKAFGDLLSDWQHVRMLCTGVAAHGGPFSQASILEELHKKFRTHDRILESYTALQSLLSWNRRALNRALTVARRRPFDRNAVANACDAPIARLTQMQRELRAVRPARAPAPAPAN